MVQHGTAGRPGQARSRQCKKEAGQWQGQGRCSGRAEVGAGQWQRQGSGRCSDAVGHDMAGQGRAGLEADRTGQERELWTGQARNGN